MNTLVIQRGHVPRTSGATGTAGEQDMARRVAAYIKAHPREGWTVKVIDADVPNSSYAGDSFVALHADGSSDKTVGGSSVGYQNSSGKLLAEKWKAAYGKVWPFSFKKDNYTAALGAYYGVRRAIAQGNRRAIIIEVGFLTNPKERAWIESHTADIGESVWDAVAGVKKEEPVADIVVTVAVKPEKLAGLKNYLKANGIYATATEWVDGRPCAVPVNPVPMRVKP